MDKALYERIAKVAYDLYEKKGRRNGCQDEDWLEAEKIVRSQLAQETAAKKERKPKVTAQKFAAKAEPQKAVVKKAARQPARTSAAKKKIFPEATI